MTETNSIADPADSARAVKVDAAINQVFDSLGEIVAKLVEQAKQGSCQHAKCVFDLARIAEFEVTRAEAPQPWVQELLTALKAHPVPAKPAPAV